MQSYICKYSQGIQISCQINHAYMYLKLIRTILVRTINKNITEINRVTNISVL